MKKYIDADKLIAEINERLMAVNLEKLGNFGAHRVWAYNDVKDIIGSLQQEQPELSKDKMKELLAWAKETYLFENASAIRKVCYKQLIDKLNLMLKDGEDEK